MAVAAQLGDRRLKWEFQLDVVVITERIALALQLRVYAGRFLWVCELYAQMQRSVRGFVATVATTSCCFVSATLARLAPSRGDGVRRGSARACRRPPLLAFVLRVASRFRLNVAKERPVGSCIFFFFLKKRNVTKILVEEG